MGTTNTNESSNPNDNILGILVDALSSREDYEPTEDELKAKACFDALSTDEKLAAYREAFILQLGNLTSPEFINPYAADKILQAVNENNTVVDIRLAVYELLTGVEFGSLSEDDD